MIPDIIITAGGSRFLVEITVTHPIDETKLSKIKKLNISTLEINLSRLSDSISDSELIELVLGSSPRKRWKYSALAAMWKRRFMQSCQKYRRVRRGYAVHVDGCPVVARTYQGLSYANILHDCSNCQYYIADCRGTKSNKYDLGSVFCSGSTKIATIQDFSLSIEERERRFYIEQYRRLTEAMGSGCCPECGSELKLRNGQYGVFYGCSGYPYCRFVLSIDPETGEIRR